MGLDISHDAWHGPYSSFMEFRIRIAAAIGESLSDFKGFGGNRPFTEIKRGVWWLLEHSDCDGHITPECCKLIADDLKQILPALSDTDCPMPSFTTRARAERFMKGCLAAHKANENLEFH